MVRTGEHSGFLVGWNDGLGWIFVQGGGTEFSPADYYIPHIHPINNLWGGISPSRREEPCWFVLCPLKYLRETMLLLRVAPRGRKDAAERRRGPGAVYACHHRCLKGEFHRLPLGCILKIHVFMLPDFRGVRQSFSPCC